MMEQITRCRFSFDDPVWESISVDAKDFISQLLQLDPNKRPTVAQTMKHRWLIRRIAAMWTTPEVGYVTPEDQKRMDEEISAAAAKQFKRRKIAMHTSATVTALDRKPDGVTATISPENVALR